MPSSPNPLEAVGRCEWCGLVDHELVAGECSRCRERVGTYGHNGGNMSENTLGPFVTGTHEGHHVGEVTVDGRLHMVKSFDREQCKEALAMPHLQATVRRAVERRMRQLDREAARHG